MMSESMMAMDGEETFIKQEIEEKLCGSVKRAVSNKEKSYADYLATYSVEMLSRDELEERFKKSLPNYFMSRDSDYFFLGLFKKEGVESVEDFIWDDLFIFMVRKEGTERRMKGING